MSSDNATIVSPTGNHPTQWTESIIQPEPWTQDALCAQTDPEAFFPDKGGSTRDAKRICWGKGDEPGCEVREQCLAYALEHDERFGIWGGFSERERRRIRRGLPPKASTGANLRVSEGGRLGAVSKLTPELAERVRALVAEGLTNVQMGERLGVTSQSIGNYRKALGLPPSRRSA